ncbi:NB-ARC domain protein [Gloeothece citriformis PCC 7424]|uniref:NB-ARC domain protein n=1 Tax=Gloeothece citriformis (strain PCC 7424) TaxID=65393 RepID=B7K8R7_GLOC7|nr:NB-ARC domain-containing protein [Gloeothece citriformis]ACK71265.1 NB-ARC domain protein [Gloeothece citriformis PCC 7424]
MENRNWRLNLLKTLNAITPEQLDMIMLILEPPPGIIPHLSATQGLRVTALLQWAESPNGCGWAEVEQILNEIISPKPETNQQPAFAKINNRVTTSPVEYPGELKKKPRFNLAPSLPSYFVERPEHSQAIKQKLLDDSTAETGILVISAIYGLGGIGKSTLASALCRDAGVESHFPDGILWVTLGQQPDLLSLVCDWIEKLGDYNYKPTNLEGASIHLGTLLYDQSVLLVVDDVWNPEHLEPFRVGGSGCRVLVTTREARILGADRYDLEVMTPEQAESLLSRVLQGNLTETQRQQAQVLAKTVGYLPLALELAAAQVADGVSWGELLEDLQGEIAYLETLDLYSAEEIPQEEKRKKYSLLASFNLSLRRLSKDDLDKFAWLGILPEDVTLTSQMAATLWNCKPRQARESLRYLRAKALLLPGVSTEKESSYRFHDLLHDLARKKLTEDPPEGLGLSLEAAHQQFLNHYRAKTKGGLWHTLPDDGYIHRYLTWHLQKAGLSPEIHQLLREETKEGANGWYWACDRLGKTSIFMQDVAQAWELAEEREWEEVASQVRYALITSSLNTLVGNIPGELMAALIDKKIWTPAQGLAYALQIQNYIFLISAISAIAPHLPSSLLLEAVSFARSIEDESDRARTLRELVPHLAKVSIEEALCVARSIEDKYYRASALSQLVTHRSELIEEALCVARSIEDKDDRASALSQLVTHRSELIEEALCVARSIEDKDDRASALSQLVTHRSELIEEALCVARSIEDKYDRARALSQLVPHRPELIDEVLCLAHSIEDEYYRARTLSELVPHLAKVSIEEALCLARSIKDKDDRASALSELVTHRSELIEEALCVARSIENEYLRVRALSQLVLHRPELIDEVLCLAHSIEDEYYRARALSQLVAHLAKVSIEEAISVARSIENEYDRAIVLSELVAHLTKVSIEEALCLARSIEDKYDRARALSQLVPHRPELIEEELCLARSIEDKYDRARALSQLVAHQPELIEETVSVTRSIESKYLRARALRELVTHLAKVSIEEAVSLARSIEDKSERARALRELVAYRPELIDEAVSVTRSIKDKLKRAETFSEILPQLISTGIDFALWKEILHLLACRNRSSLLHDIEKLTPVILQFGGKEAIKEVFQAIQDVGRWWK